MDKNIKSVLELKRLVFDYISFKREGFSSDAEFQLKLKSVISKKKYEELYHRLYSWMYHAALQADGCACAGSRCGPADLSGRPV